MADALLPEAAGLVVDVHEGSAEDIRTRLQGLTRHELEAIAVLVAALADPDQTMKDALAWVTFDENGAAVGPVQTRSEKRLRDVTPRLPRRKPRERLDVVLIERALRPGARVDLTRGERRLAVDLGIRRGMSYDDLAERLGMEKASVQTAWERAKKRARTEGRWVPPVAVGQIRTAA
ncbi:hypothetical protein ACIPW9_36505 [Streptomyces sp. NPDC090052]|uniref:hypothetical protein n=1 Tax=Streptomyces sp. NPDC090052 TaxID=3365931 RepID=UPI003822691A